MLAQLINQLRCWLSQHLSWVTKLKPSPVLDTLWGPYTTIQNALVSLFFNRSVSYFHHLSSKPCRMHLSRQNILIQLLPAPEQVKLLTQLLPRRKLLTQLVRSRYILTQLHTPVCSGAAIKFSKLSEIEKSPFILYLTEHQTLDFVGFTLNSFSMQ